MFQNIFFINFNMFKVQMMLLMSLKLTLFNNKTNIFTGDTKGAEYNLY